MNFFTSAAVAIVTALPTMVFAQDDVWSGPEWATASCSYDEQVVSYHRLGVQDSATNEYRSSKVTHITHPVNEGDQVMFRWYPVAAEVELLCGEKFILLVIQDDIIFEVTFPRPIQEQ